MIFILLTEVENLFKTISCLSEQSKELNENTRGDRPISPSKPLSTSCMSKNTLLFNAIEELLLKGNSLKIV